MAGNEPEGFPMDSEFLDDLEGEAKEQAKELLTELSIGSLWLNYTMSKDEEDPGHQSGHMLIGVAHAATDAVMRIAQIESAKSGVLGIAPEIVLGVGRSVFSALLLAGVRFGQRHPDAFGGAISAGEVDELMTNILDILKGGEAGPETPDQP